MEAETEAEEEPELHLRTGVQREDRSPRPEPLPNLPPTTLAHVRTHVPTISPLHPSLYHVDGILSPYRTVSATSPNPPTCRYLYVNPNIVEASACKKNVELPSSLKRPATGKSRPRSAPPPPPSPPAAYHISPRLVNPAKRLVDATAVATVLHDFCTIFCKLLLFL